jgi:hypothetical protein
MKKTIAFFDAGPALSCIRSPERLTGGTVDTGNAKTVPSIT